MGKEILKMEHITKIYPNGVMANRDVSFSVREGEIHALMGENGAGKSTLMKILFGDEDATEGDIIFEGNKIQPKSAADTIRLGIGMVHQHFSLVPSMTVAENVVIGRPPYKKGLIDLKKSEQIVAQLSAEYGLEIDPKMRVSDLTVGLQQRVEILKALYLGAEILIMDEPTAVLTPQEIKQLMETLRSLKEKGKCIILITHKLAEVRMVTDRITVMRAGVVTARVNTADTDEKKIAMMMVGREVILEVDKQPFHPGETVLSLKNISCFDRMGLPAVRDVSFDVHRGEVVGIAGVQGNGQSELAAAASVTR